MNRALSAVAVTLLLLRPSVALTAQDSNGWVPTGWEISPYIGLFDDVPEFHPGGSSSIFVDPARNIAGGGHVAYNFASGLFADFEGGYMPFDMRIPTRGTVDLDLAYFSGGVGYNLPLSGRLQAYGVVGLGAAHWRPEELDPETDLSLGYGGGVRLRVVPRLALRVEARMHQIPDALANTAAELAGSAAPSETFRGWGLSLGASYFLGGESQRDGDGDGVLDGLDACPETPMGAGVDERGCALDSDGDGVADHADQCPGTPAGAEVDENGCPTDADGDGVVDGLDRCPNTPSGAEVDAAGCPVVVEPEPEPEPEPELIFGNVHFAHDSAELDAAASSILDESGNALSDRPNERVRVVGHADSVGPEDYNLALSLRRAQAVRDYLAGNFPALDADRFQIAGAGESQPVADNTTGDGRRQNRRVEILPAGTR